ncbi:MAG TPA: hypothetical protein VEC37_02320 [Bacillota bacterium]|nr:hypothetical protein [Bacillota bacterium]
MRKSLSEQSVLRQILVIGVAWLILSSLDFIADKIWHLNENGSWGTYLAAGAIYGILLLAVQAFFKDLFKAQNKFKYLFGFILYVIFWFIINWHRIQR